MNKLLALFLFVATTVCAAPTSVVYPGNVVAAGFVGSGAGLTNVPGVSAISNNQYFPGFPSGNAMSLSNSTAVNVARVYDGPPLFVYEASFSADIEDMAGLTVAARMHRKGVGKLLAIYVTGAGNNTNGLGNTVGAVNAILGYHGITDVPLCVYTNDQYCGPSGWTTNIAKSIYSQISYTNVGGVSVLRRALASAPDKSVTWFQADPLTGFTNFLCSQPDQYSSLVGSNLFDQKVKLWLPGGGDYPNYIANAGGEFNFQCAPSASQFALSNMPPTTTTRWWGTSLGPANTNGTPPIWSYTNGFKAFSPKNPLYNAAAIAGIYGGDTTRPGWTSTLLCIAAYGSNYLGTNIFGFVTTGYNVISPNTGSGTNYWVQDSVDHGQGYLSYINTNVVQQLVNYWLYMPDFDPPDTSAYLEVIPTPMEWWPSAAKTAGGAALVNFKGKVYLMSSSDGATAWVQTNALWSYSFDPTNNLSGVIGYYDSRIKGLTTNTYAYWSNLVTGGLELTNQDAATMPSMITTSGVPVVRFAQKYLGNAGMSPTQPFFYFIVYREWNTTPSTGTLFASWTGNTAQMVLGGGTHTDFEYLTDGSTDLVGWHHAPAPTAWRCQMIEYNGGSSAIYTNIIGLSRAYGAEVTGDAGANNPNGFTLGSFSDHASTYAPFIDVACLVIATNIPSATVRSNLFLWGNAEVIGFLNPQSP